MIYKEVYRLIFKEVYDVDTTTKYVENIGSITFTKQSLQNIMRDLNDFEFEKVEVVVYRDVLTEEIDFGIEYRK